MSGKMTIGSRVMVDEDTKRSCWDWRRRERDWGGPKKSAVVVGFTWFGDGSKTVTVRWDDGKREHYYQHNLYLLDSITQVLPDNSQNL